MEQSSNFLFIANSLLSKAIDRLAPFFFPVHLWQQPPQPALQSRWQIITWYFWTLAIITLFVAENPEFVTVLGPMASVEPPEDLLPLLLWIFAYPLQYLVQDAWLLFLLWGFLALPLGFFGLKLGNKVFKEKLFKEKPHQKNGLPNVLLYALFFVVIMLLLPIIWIVLVMILSQALMVFFVVGKATGIAPTGELVFYMLIGVGAVLVTIAVLLLPKTFFDNPKKHGLAWAAARFGILVFLTILAIAYIYTIIQGIQGLFWLQ